MIQQAYNYVSLSKWPCLTFFGGLKITYMLKSSGWGLEKSESPWEQNPLSVFSVDISLDDQRPDGQNHPCSQCTALKSQAT